MKQVVSLPALLLAALAGAAGGWLTARFVVEPSFQLEASGQKAPESVVSAAMADKPQSTQTLVLADTLLAPMQERLQQLEVRLEMLTAKLEQDQFAMQQMQAGIDRLDRQLVVSPAAAVLPQDAEREVSPLPEVAAATLAEQAQAVATGETDGQDEAQQVFSQAQDALEASTSQLNEVLRSTDQDVNRQLTIQQLAETALNKAGMQDSVVLSTVECSTALCRFEISGTADNRQDVLQPLWENQVFPEQTEVMTIPHTDGQGWTVYVAAEGQSLPEMPR